MNLKTIPQKGFYKGLATAFGLYEQPKGTLPRIGNMLLSKRGTLQAAKAPVTFATKGDASIRSYFTDFAVHVAADGTQLPLALQVAGPTNSISFLPAPAQPTLTSVNVFDGTLTPGTTYTYQITGIDNLGGETTPCAETSIVLGGGDNAVKITFPNTEVVAYRVYGRTAGSTGLFDITVVPVTTWTQAADFTDTGDAVPGTSPPGVNNTKSLVLEKIIGTYTELTLVAVFTPPGPFFGGSPSIGPCSIYGGGPVGRPDGSPPEWVGNTSPQSQLVPFAGKIVLILGNNHPIYVYDPPTAPVQLTNTFSATIPDWVTASGYTSGDLILPTVNNAGGYIFTCTQAGLSGAANPTFPQTQDQTVADAQVIWSNTGKTADSPPPRGAAHGIAYGGSLVVGNTYPQSSADGLDGPNVVAFSDSDNPVSWNPINRVQVARDDGQQISGLASFVIADTGILPQGGLVVFREYSTFLILGFPPNEQVVQVNTNRGCIAPRSISFVPGFGVIRLTHEGWAVFDGINDTLISDAIANVINPDPVTIDSDLPFLVQAWTASAIYVSDPPMYICGVTSTTASVTAGTGLNLLYALDVPGKCWTTLSVPTAKIMGMKAIYTLSVGTGTVVPSNLPKFLFGYFDGSQVAAFQFGGTSNTPLSTTGMAWTFRTPAVFGQANMRTYFRRVTLRGIAWKASPNLPVITCTVTIDGAAGSVITPLLRTIPGTTYFECIVDVGAVGFAAYADWAGDSGVEIWEIDWEAAPVSVGVPLSVG